MKRLEKGFTLIELMIVVAIIAILAAVAAPKFGQQLKKAKDAKAIGLLGTWRSGSSLYYSDNDAYATDLYLIKDSMDASAFNNVYKSLAGATLASGDKQMFLEVGTGKDVFTGGSAKGKPSLTADYTTDGAITVTAGQGNDTKSTPWVNY